jgi:hypothetical protein
MQMVRRYCLCLASLAFASTVDAQSIRGVVRDSTTGAVLTGVVVSQLDSRGIAVTRVLTTNTGFTLASQPGGARLNFRRIGFIPYDTTVAGDSRLEIKLRRRVTQLAPIVATDEKRCSERSDRRAALALWEEARSAFLAASVLLDTREATAWIARYRYNAGPNRGTQSVARREQHRAGQLLRAALPAADFANGGYVRDTAGLRVYYSPDEMVLVDDSFVATHCFSIGKKPRGDDPTVAIRFEPDKRQKNNVDIEGLAVLRLDPLELLRIDFRYTNLPAHEDRLEPGGFVEYGMTSLGVSIATHWHMRHPIPVAMVTHSHRDSTWNEGVVSRNIPEEIGFVLESAEWSGYTPWKRALPVVSGQVIGPGASRFDELVVELMGTPYRMVPDDSGRFAFANVLPGRYSLRVYDPLLLPLGVRRVGGAIIDVDSSGITPGRNARLEFSRDAALKAACSEDGPHNLLLRRMAGDAILLGRVVDSAGVPGRSAKLRVIVESPKEKAAVIEGSTNGSGFFRLCHLGIGQTVTVSAIGSSGRLAEMKGRVDGPLHTITIVVK